MGALVSRFGAALLALLALALRPAFGHRLDEYLQATLVSIEPDAIRLMINLTPGVEVADGVLGRIDWNRDGAISASEEATYAELLRRDLELRLDGQTLAVELVAARFPPPAELRSGEGIIALELVATRPVLTTGRHVLAIENRHFPAIGVYLLNAVRPTSRSVAIAAQTRNDAQSVGAIEFTIAPDGPAVAR